MRTRMNVGQASRLSHSFPNHPRQRRGLSINLETGWKPVLLWLALLLMPIAASAQTYNIDWYKISGGGGTSTGGVYSVSGIPHCGTSRMPAVK